MVSNHTKTIFLLFTIFLMVSCHNQKGDNVRPEESLLNLNPKFSLAQWSFHKELFAGEMSNVDFVIKAGEMGFEGVEYVNQFFKEKYNDSKFLDSLNQAAQVANVKNLLIMVDGIGDLGSPIESERMEAVENCKQWIKAANYLNCPYIRINAHGNVAEDVLKQNIIKSISELHPTAQSNNITILIENHGGISNNGQWLSDLVNKLEKYKVAALPDFDNWCIERENGELWGAPCVKSYDRYRGLEELMPFAKALSVKAIQFDSLGNEVNMDYEKIFKIVVRHGYEGYLGIEYEGEELSSEEGIIATRLLANRSWMKAIENEEN